MIIPGIVASRYGAAAADPAFYAPLTSSLALSIGAATPTFTRATTATCIDSAGLITSCASGEARFAGSTHNATNDWTAHANSQGILIEEQRTNICTYSQSIVSGTGSWFDIAAATVGNYTTAPDGTSTASRLIDDSSTGTGTVRMRGGTFTVTSAVDMCWSVFAKADQLNWIVLDTVGFDASANGTSFFDLSTGSVGTKSANHSASGVESYGSGWHRCWIVFKTTTDVIGYINLYVANADNDYSVDKDGTSSVLVWGSQLEAGSFPTSYIPNLTTGSTTRNADVLTYNYQPNALSGSMLAQMNLLKVPATAARHVLSSSATCIFALNNTTNFEANDGTTTLNYTGMAAGSNKKIGLTWDDGASPEQALYLAGSQVTTGALDAGGYDPSTNPLGVGCRGSDGTLSAGGTIKEVKFYTTALSQAEMESATSG